jgi:hypothetical protein
MGLIQKVQGNIAIWKYYRSGWKESVQILATFKWQAYIWKSFWIMFGFKRFSEVSKRDC